MKFQIQSAKSQIILKSQIQNSKQFDYLNLGHFNLFGACNLDFGIFL